MALVSLTTMAKYFGAVRLFSDVSLQIDHGDRAALVGANGTGKSTLLRLICGLEKADGGEIAIARGVRIGYLPQEAHFHSQQTLREAMLSVFKRLRQDAQRLEQLHARLTEAGSNPMLWPADVLDDYTALLTRFEEQGGYTYEQRVDRVLTGMGFPRESWERPAQGLSGGQRTRAHLARLLLEEPDVLLLDEPTNHLDLATTEWLENTLMNWSGGLLIVSHDRYFLDRTTRRTLDLADGTLDAYPAPYSRYVQLRAERIARHQKEFQDQQDMIARTEEFIRRNGAGQRAKEARGRQTKLNRVERLSPVRQQGSIRLDMATSMESANVVLTTLRLRIGFDRHQLLYVPDVHVKKGARIALIGPNGAGKSTLLRTLISQQASVSGAFLWGSGTQPGYYAQAHEGLDVRQTIVQAIQTARPMTEEDARALLARFLFRGDTIFKVMRDLSGGERSRVALCVLTLRATNVLLLDEPTNHLDIQARQALEETLREYSGTLLFTSHDRYFISALATDIWAIENGIVRVYPGSYSDYLTNRTDGRYVPEKPSSTAARQTNPANEPIRKQRSVREPSVAPATFVISHVDPQPLLDPLVALEQQRQTLYHQLSSTASANLEELLRVGANYDAVTRSMEQADLVWLAMLQATLRNA